MISKLEGGGDKEKPPETKKEKNMRGTRINSDLILI